jgi:hypothetical protein
MNVCKHIAKMAPCDSFKQELPGEVTERREELETKEKGSYLKLITGLCLEDRKN